MQWRWQEHAFGRPSIPRWKQWAGLSAGVIAVLVAAISLYKGGLHPVLQTTPTPIKPAVVTPSQTPFRVIAMESSSPVIGLDALSMVATTAIHVPALGLDAAFITSQQSQSMMGAIPPGARVMKIESSGAAAKVGINASDIIEAIGSQKIDTLDDLRKAFRELGPGKTQFTISHSGIRKTILVDCPNC